jgi:hypothetical protein
MLLCPYATRVNTEDGSNESFETLIFLLPYVFISWGVEQRPLDVSATRWPLVPAADDEECGAVREVSSKGGEAGTAMFLPNDTGDISEDRTRGK